LIQRKANPPALVCHLRIGLAHTQSFDFSATDAETPRRDGAADEELPLGLASRRARFY